MRIALSIVALWAACTVHAAGTNPAVNTDMGCTTAGQALNYDGSTISCRNVKVPSGTVSGLPTCNAGAAGTLYIVTDALAPVALATVSGSGAITTLVVCTGSAWVVG